LSISSNLPHKSKLFKRIVAPLVAFAALAIAAHSVAAQSTSNVTYVDILHQLTDLDRLAHLQPDKHAGLFSSWDRNSRTVWGANGDSGQYLRTEPNGEAVMVDVDGPGVIYRTWSANPVGKIRIYLDGEAKPRFEWNFPDLFDGKMAPFIRPIVYRRDSAQSASDCYLPIPFSKHIKITADKAQSQYYQFNYLLYPKSCTLPDFHLPLSNAEQTALLAAAKAWSHPELDPKPVLPGQKTIRRTLTLAPGKSINLATLHGAGTIRSIKIKASSRQRYVWRKLLLSCVWDRASWPQVLTPIGPFFGFDWDTPDYASVISGCRDGQAYQYLPMPFRKSADITLKNYLEQPANIEVEITWAPVASQPADMVYFYARWRHEPDSTTFDYPFLETAGHGHFVGVSMPIDYPLGGWWGEGDDKVWVDDDDFPPWIGTGSEDYFGDAWGIRYLSGPSYGAAAMSDSTHRTSNYRWHFLDMVPFTKRMRMTIENYGPNGQGPRGQYDYSSTAFWYQSELTPPFAELKGISFTGGDDPLGPPKKMEYSPSTMMDIKPSDLHTYGLGITFAQQAELLLADEIKGGRAKIVTDGLRRYEFDRERAVDLGAVHAGQALGNITLSASAEGVYFPRIYTAPEEGTAQLTLTQNTSAAAVKIVSQPTNRSQELAGIYLKKGAQPVTLVAATDGRAILNCIQLEPANRVRDAIEAEELILERTTGGAPLPQPGQPDKSASAGRTLDFHAEREGQGVVVNLGKRPKLPYVLGVRPFYGPSAGIIQAFVADHPIGPKFDLYAAARHPGDSVLPLGPAPSGSATVEIRIVGRNTKSQGYDASLDYFRWEPDLIGPGTIAGIWAQVVGTHDCEYRAQDLGDAYSGGHQFWMQPCELNGWADIAVEIPSEGDYDIIARYTKSWDYATVQAFLDDRPIGTPTDTYAEVCVPGDPTTLGHPHLAAGRHILRFKAVGHNAHSKGYLVGIDHIIIK